MLKLSERSPDLLLNILLALSVCHKHEAELKV